MKVVERVMAFVSCLIKPLNFTDTGNPSSSYR